MLARAYLDRCQRCCCWVMVPGDDGDDPPTVRHAEITGCIEALIRLRSRLEHRRAMTLFRRRLRVDLADTLAVLNARIIALCNETADIRGRAVTVAASAGRLPAPRRSA